MLPLGRDLHDVRWSALRLEVAPACPPKITTKRDRPSMPARQRRRILKSVTASAASEYRRVPFVQHVFGKRRPQGVDQAFLHCGIFESFLA
jgi:hypothetical protein